jgi:hypothetical protein
MIPALVKCFYTTVIAGATYCATIPSPAPAPVALPTARPVARVTATPQATPAASVAPLPGQQKLATSDSVAEAIGVDTHFNYHNTAYMAANGNVKRLLLASGIRHVRDSSAGTFIHTGVGLGFPASSAYCQKEPGHEACIETSASIAQKFKASPLADYFEMSGNESDDLAETGKSQAVLDAIWVPALEASNAIESGWIRKVSPSLPMLGGSVASAQDALKLKDMSASIDFANMHSGTGALNPAPPLLAAQANAIMHEVGGKQRYWVTETGYGSHYTLPSAHAASCASTAVGVDCSLYGRPNSLPDSIIEAYDVRTILGYLNLGAGRVYLYQFADMSGEGNPKDCGDDTFGATGLVTGIYHGALQGGGPVNCHREPNINLTVDATPKPQYFAIANLVALFSDPGVANFHAATMTPAPQADPGTAPIRLTASANVQHRYFKKRDGTLLVAVWREEQDWNQQTQAACARATVARGSSYSPKPCYVSTEPVVVTIPGYKETLRHAWQPSGHVLTAPPASPTITLSTGDLVVAEFHPSTS